MEKKATILIVDENTSLSDTLSTILEQSDYVVSVAGNGTQAVERVQEKSFDVIFMDIKIFLQQGGETYRQVKKARPTCEVVVTMTSKSSQESQDLEPLEEVIWGPLFKPFGAEKVFAVIEDWKNVRAAALIPSSSDDVGVQNHERLGKYYV